MATRLRLAVAPDAERVFLAQLRENPEVRRLLSADRLRVITSDGTNLRVNVDDGKATVDGALKFKDGDANAGKTDGDAPALAAAIPGTMPVVIRVVRNTCLRQ